MSLQIHLFSFGFRVSGLPEDPGGNGGGFVFDCRSLPNPGREERFRPLTGLDPEVRDYLREDEGVERFFLSTLRLVQDAAANYLERGFTDMMVAYGCTGGQHRSVYLAERLCEAVMELPDVEVNLWHTEKPHWPERH